MVYSFKKQTIHDVLNLALPAVGEMTLYMMIWVLDTIMVGQYGGNIGVSSVGISSEILYTFVNIFIAVGISISITSLVARKFGAKKITEAEEYATLGLFIGTIVSFIIFLFCFIFSKNILIIAGAKNEVIKLSNIYMKIASIAIFFNMLTNLLNGILRGYGNTKTPLFISAIINIVNLTLDYLLIFGIGFFPELGVKGAAIATLIAEITGFIFASSYMLKNSKIKIKFKYIKLLNKKRLLDLIKLSIPSSMQEGAFDICKLINTFMIMHIGSISFAANQITTSIESLSFMPGWGFAIAATTLVGHKIGEKNYKKAQEYAHTCAFLGTSIMLLCGIMFLIFPNFLISLFIQTTEKEVIKLGSLCVMIASVEQPAMALSMIYGGALKGMGDTRTPFIISVISNWIIRLPLIYYVIYIAKLPVHYVWWVTAIQWGFDGLLMVKLFKIKFKRIYPNNTI
ncbi:MATE family efflux transporter [Haloimpatiens sp. FM7330]|uniref:MATE family efflux transporter n=1 Tax=Haloimpatiens sp. FM7330 TaxID=3298610 RepID=UPI003629CF02